jgi:SAM-dependent methyltransferase
MSGAHRAAYDFILPRVAGNEKVLDLGAGAAPLAGWLAKKGCLVYALDRDGDKLTAALRNAGGTYETIIADATDLAFWSDYTAPRAPFFDLIVAVFSIQHMLGRQAFVWSQVAQLLRSGGRFIVAGRNRNDAPRLECDRADPLLAENSLTLTAMAMASGLEVLEIKLVQYWDEQYRKATADAANQYVALLRKL